MENLPIVSIEGGRAEEGGEVTFVIRLSEMPTEQVTLSYLTRSGTGLTGTDVVEESRTITFAAGQLVATVRVRNRSDSRDEVDESFALELFNVVGARFGGANQSLQAIGWSLDGDGPGNNRAIAVSSPTVVEGAGTQAAFTISLSEPFTTATTVSFATYDGAARAGSDYVARAGTITFAAGQTEATVLVNLIDDGVVEAGETFGLRVTATGVPGATGQAAVLNDDGALPIVSIEGGRAEEGGEVTFVIRLSEAPAAEVTVDYLTRSGSALIGTDVVEERRTVVFAAGQLVATVQVRNRTDSVDEVDESFTLDLFNAVGASFGGANQSLQAIGWSLDGDGLGNNRAIAVSSPTVVERPGAVATFSIELSQPSTTAITVRYQAIGQSAAAGADFVAATGQVTFAAGQTRAEVSVGLLTDAGIEAAESFILRVLPPYPVQIAGGAAVAEGRATILDFAIRGTPGNDVRTGTALADRIEGLAGNDTLYGGAGNDGLYGGAGNDILDGGLGADRMEGGTGNDIIVVNVAGDAAIEGLGAGVDQVNAAISYALQGNFEVLVLTGAGATNGAGNGLANRVVGNAAGNVLQGLGGNDVILGAGGADTVYGGLGNDVLAGGAGRDIVIGGGGNDAFLFAVAAAGGDVITDFGAVAGNNDGFRIGAAGFGGGLVAGAALAGARFQVRADNLAQDLDDRFVFRTTDQTLWFDANGSAAGGLTLIADLQAGAVVTSADILLV